MKKIRASVNIKYINLFLSFLICLLIGLNIGRVLYSPPIQPDYAVAWSFEGKAKIPNSLYSYLTREVKDDCAHYKGTDSPKGTHLAAVHEVVDDRYAFVNIGCESINYSGAEAGENLFPVIKKEDGTWKLISAASYWGFSTDDNKSYPNCSVVDKYKISKLFAPTCIQDTDSYEENMQLTSKDVKAVDYP